MNMPCQLVAENMLGSDIVKLQQLGGGDFAQSYRALLRSGKTVFLKTHINPPANFFTTEAIGLRWLRDSGAVAVPKVLAVNDEPPFLVLEWIELGSAKGNTEADFGRDLATLHAAKFSTYGRPDQRTTGSQGLPNSPCQNWSEFYATQRLLPLAKIAKDKGVLSSRVVTRMESVASCLQELGGPPEEPSLLHGDLWAGNRVVDVDGRSWLIDPAACGGHREFDLAMMRLFGGFGDRCFSAYQDSFPLADGWESRVALHQLAPLAVHAIKFGGHYVGATEQVLNSYG